MKRRWRIRYYKAEGDGPLETIIEGINGMQARIHFHRQYADCLIVRCTEVGS